MLVGVVFGVLSAGVLSLPLVVELPGRSVVGWPYVPHDAALLALLVGLATPFVAGFAAAVLDREDPVEAGAVAAVLGGLVSGALVVTPAALVSPAREVLGRMNDASFDELTSRAALAELLVALQQGPALAGLALDATGASLGAVGGLVRDLWSGSGSRPPKQVHRSSVPVVASLGVTLALVLDLLWSAHADVTLLPALGHPLGFVGRARWTAPVAAAGLAQAVLAAWTLRDAVLLGRAGRWGRGVAWGALGLGPVGLSGLAVLLLHPWALWTPAFWIVPPIVLVSGLGTLLVARAGTTRLHERPRTLLELVGEGTAAGVVTVGLACLTGLSPVLGAALLGRPLVAGLLGVTDEPDPRFLVGRLYLVHLALPFLMAAVAGGYGVLATPTWMVGRVVGSGGDRS